MVIKRLALLALALVLVLGMVLAGCTKEEAAAPSGEQTIILGGAPANFQTSRIKDSLIAGVVEENTNYSVKIRGGLGMITEMRFAALENGDISFMSDILGRGLLEEQLDMVEPGLSKHLHYLALFPEFRQPVPLIVTADLPITSLRDAIDKHFPMKVGVGGGGSYLFTDYIWEAMGSPDGVDAVTQWGGVVDNKSDPFKIPDLMKEGILNAYMCTGSIFSAQLQALSSSLPMKALPVAQSDEDLKAVQAALLATTRFVMEPGHYSFVKEEVPVVAKLKCFIGSPKLSEQAAYDITKAVMENADFLQAGTPGFNAIDPEWVQLAKNLGVEFHPGAIRYYQEAGIW